MLPRCRNCSEAETFPISLKPVESANINGLILQPGNEQPLMDRRNHTQVPLQRKTCRAQKKLRLPVAFDISFKISGHNNKTLPSAL